MLEEEVDYEIYCIEREIKIRAILEDLAFIGISPFLSNWKPRILQMPDAKLDECREIVSELVTTRSKCSFISSLDPLFIRLDTL